MVFTEKQRVVLFTAWKNGHLCDTKNYGTLANATGLSRKQISNWTRTQVKKLGDKSLPKKTDTSVRSIFYKLPERMRNYKDWSEVGENKVRQKKSRFWFTLQQRKVLFLAFERGFLCDHKNYGALADITGLSKKQISNWTRKQINKIGEEGIPEKNGAPLRTIYKELIVRMQEDSNVSPQHSMQKPQHLKMTRVVDNSSSKLPPSILQPHKNSKPFTTQSIKKVPQPLQIVPDKAGDLIRQYSDSKKSSGAPQFTSTVVHQSRDYSKKFATYTPIDKEDFDQPYPNNSNVSIIFLSPTNQWVIKNALKGINEVNDRKVQILSILSKTKVSDIIFYLLDHSWELRLADHGFCYVRNESKSSSQQFLGVIGKKVKQPRDNKGERKEDEEDFSQRLPEQETTRHELSSDLMDLPPKVLQVLRNRSKLPL